MFDSRQRYPQQIRGRSREIEAKYDSRGRLVRSPLNTSLSVFAASSSSYLTNSTPAVCVKEGNASPYPHLGMPVSYSQSLAVSPTRAGTPVPQIPMPAPWSCAICTVCRKGFADVFQRCASCRGSLCSSCYSQCEFSGTLAFCRLCHYEGDYTCGQ